MRQLPLVNAWGRPWGRPLPWISRHTHMARGTSRQGGRSPWVIVGMATVSDSGTWTAHHTLQAGTSMELRAAPRDQEGAGTPAGLLPQDQAWASFKNDEKPPRGAGASLGP